MLHQPTVSKQPPAEAALDHKALFALGLQHVKRLASRIWTDYNVHDPGITTLELLCYALTDLSYRASFPVADLLAVKGDFSGVVVKVDVTAGTVQVEAQVGKEIGGKVVTEAQTLEFVVDDDTNVTRAVGGLSISDLKEGMAVSVESKTAAGKLVATVICITDIHIAERFTARRILPNRPLTELDYRKLMIDIKGVRNAWLKRHDLSYFADTVTQQLSRTRPALPGIREVPIAGLYDVLIDCELGSGTPAVLAEVSRRLQANRNLCEDFVGFARVGEQSFNLCCELELAPDADTSLVKAQILFQVQQYLAPPVRNYTLSEMLERRHSDGRAWTADEVFDGPALDCGFIDDTELAEAELRTEIRLSDIVSLIMDIEGVLAIRDIVMNPDGTDTPLEEKWVIPVASGHKAVLSLEHSRLVFYKRNMPVPAVAARVDEYYSNAEAAAITKAETAFPYDLPVPRGTFRQPVKYFSFQNHFPSIYGLGEVGLPSGADDVRRAKAYQLKAYLLFCDQVMADYFAQLSRVKDLFSTDPGLDTTYFHQAVDSFSEFEKVYKGAGMEATRDEIVETLLASDDSAVSLDRRNRFLDHMLARFAERFTDFAHIMYAAFGSDPRQMAALKCEFLDGYPAISSERALAYNYTLKKDEDLWNSENVSGLERRLARLLGVRNFKRRNLGDIAYDFYPEKDSTPGDEFRFRIRNKDTGAILLSSSKSYATEALAMDEMVRAVQAALLPSGYQRKVTTGGKHYFNVVNGTGDVLARRIEYFDTLDKMEHAIGQVMDYLGVTYSDEGMYLIENILLRPEQDTDPFLPIHLEPGSPDNAQADPYSYRIHIILPAYGSRFANMDFRRFAEEVIREETPAHILPKICWISKEEMAVLEKRYRDWVYLKAGAERSDRLAKLSSFMITLFSVRNVYPEEKLQSCATGEDQPKFILGQTALGTMKESEPE